MTRTFNYTQGALCIRSRLAVGLAKAHVSGRRQRDAESLCVKSYSPESGDETITYWQGLELLVIRDNAVIDG
jgi:hypothetical protein